MFLAANDSAVIGSYVTGITGLLAAIAAFYKVRPDANRTAVSASEGAVIVQSSVIKDLRDENARLKEAHKDCESTLRQTRKDHWNEIEELKAQQETEIEKYESILATIEERKQRRLPSGEEPK